MRRQHVIRVAALVALAVPAAVYVAARLETDAGVPRELISETTELSVERYMQHITYLASDEMRGRASGSPELETAAEYIASQFAASALRPAGEDGTYFQRFDVTTGMRIGPDNALSIDGEALAPDRDFVPTGFSSSGRVEAPLAFAGYGITAPELGWDDYRGLAAAGKVVVVFRHEPQERNRRSAFNGEAFTAHATLVNKAINARQHGAAGIVFVADPVNHSSEPDVVGPAARNPVSAHAGILAQQARLAPVLAVFGKAGKDLAAIQARMDSTFTPASFELPGVRVRIVSDVAPVRNTVRNVIGAVTGSDPARRDEWLVVGAHYDHVGVGDRSSAAPEAGQIFHGADDNASGTSGLLELARAVARHRGSFKRSVLFVAFAAEELGLIGSSNFVEHATVPLDRIDAMINLDMIGRPAGNRVVMYGVGTSPDFRSFLNAATAAVGLKPSYSEEMSPTSDSWSFNRKRIPVLFFHSEMHGDYHKPSDTADKIDGHGGVRILSMVYLTAGRIAAEAARLRYTDVREGRMRSGIRALVERVRPTGVGTGGYGAAFGSYAASRDDGAGALLSDVRHDSPAAHAGLKAGDLVVAIDGKPIQHRSDLVYLLQVKRPGDDVIVAVQRGGRTLTVTVTLEAGSPLTRGWL